MSTHSKRPELLWTPKQAGRAAYSTAMDKYRQHINSKFNADIKTTQDLVQWSNEKPQEFWVDLYSYLGLVPPLPPSVTKAYDEKAPISSNPPFFEGHLINYAENALFSNPNPNATALIGLREGQELDDAEHITWAEFRDQVRLTASALRRSGIKKGDRVGALVATSNFAMILFHATAAIGAIFTCISPDLGLEGCVSRLQQVTPSILFVDGDAVYKGKTVSTIEKLDRILARLKPVPLTFVVPIASQQLQYPTTEDFLMRASQQDALTFTRVSFNDPLMICYSSGVSDHASRTTFQIRFTNNPTTDHRRSQMHRPPARPLPSNPQDLHPPQLPHPLRYRPPILLNLLGSLLHHVRTLLHRRDNNLLQRQPPLPRRQTPPAPRGEIPRHLLRQQSSLPARSGNVRLHA